MEFAAKEKKDSRFTMNINIDIEMVTIKLDWLNIDKDGTSIHDYARYHSHGQITLDAPTDFIMF